VEPYVALMRRYCIDYTSVHDPTVCDEIMSPDYRITISGRTMGMEDYRRAVEAAFRRYPTLVLTVHDMMLSGDRLAMRFSEHGAAADDPDHVAVWQGISLYRWDGSRLLTCRVEQDFAGRDEQTTTGVTAPLEPGHPDPWATTRDTPGREGSESVVRDWIDALAADPAAALTQPGVRVMERGTPLALLDDVEVTVDDLFSAGDRVAAGLTLRGTYAGGLDGVDDAAVGAPGELPVTLLSRVQDDELAAAEIVRDVWGLERRLRKALRS
jgi:predicted ester cyclase